MLARRSDSHVVFNEELYGMRIAQRAGTVFHPVHDICIALVRDGWLAGGVIFTNYTEESIAMHSAGFLPGWVTRDMLWVCFDYPFNQLGVKRIFGQVPEDNEVALKFNLHLGFKVINRIEGVYKGDIACLLVRMERDECRFLTLKPRGVFARTEQDNGR